MRRRWWLWIAGLLWLAAPPAAAHPLAPGLLDVRERADGALEVVWKTPRKREPGVELAPRLPAGCAFESSGSEVEQGTARVRVREARCNGGPLAGRTISVEGIEASRVGVLVRVELATGATQSRMLDAAHPDFVIAAAPTAGSVVGSFVRLGIEHLVTGVDHALFLAALTVLLGFGRRLIWTLTLFTVGHSITLALTALGWVGFPVPAVEAAIAFSIVAVASELAGSGRPGWFSRYPYPAAGAFGLLHGMGFAGALAAIGLPSGEIPLALLGFNVGIELGQLAVVGAMLGLVAGVRSLGVAPPARFQVFAGYTLGTIAAVWFWQRLGGPPLG